MKKFLKIFLMLSLCACFCVSVCACGNSDKDSSGGNYPFGDDVQEDIFD